MLLITSYKKYCYVTFKTEHWGTRKRTYRGISLISLQVVLPDLLAMEESHYFFPWYEGDRDSGARRLMDFVSFPLEFDRPIRINRSREMKREDGIQVLMTGKGPELCSFVSESALPAFIRDLLCLLMNPSVVIEIDHLFKDGLGLFDGFDFMAFTFKRESSLEVIKALLDFSF